MNVQEGDLCIVVNATRKHLIGLIVKIKCRSDIPERFPEHWLSEPEYFDGNTRIHFKDSHLRPIRDPGDDATDEMIQRLGSPNKQEQKA